MDVVRIETYDGDVTRLQFGCSDIATDLVAYFLPDHNIKHISLTKSVNELCERSVDEMARAHEYTREYWEVGRS